MASVRHKLLRSSLFEMAEPLISLGISSVHITDHHCTNATQFVNWALFLQRKVLKGMKAAANSEKKPILICYSIKNYWEARLILMLAQVRPLL